MTVPLLDLHAQYTPLRQALLDAVTRVCDSQRFIGGPEVEGLERELCAQLRRCRTRSGCRREPTRVLAALMALDIGPGDEVITPTYSFFATAGCVVRLGAQAGARRHSKPGTFNIDPAANACRRSRQRTKAIIPVHLFGQSADLAPIVDAAGRSRHRRDRRRGTGHRLRRITDRPVGTWGAIGCFSFFPSKNLGAFGDAGFVTATDAGMAKKLRLIRTHGMEPKYYHHLVGANFRIDAMQAAVLRVKLPHLPAWSEARRRNAARYRALFADAGLERSGAAGRSAGAHAHLQPVRDSRARARSVAARISIRRASAPRSTIRCRFICRNVSRTWATSRARSRLPKRRRTIRSALPIYPELTEAQQAAVVNAIRTFYRG